MSVFPLIHCFHAGRGATSALIRWRTWTPAAYPITHVSTLLPDGRLLEAWQGDTLSQVVRGRGQVQATRTLADVVESGERVWAALVPAEPAKAAAARDYWLARVGTPYDYRGILSGFLLRRPERGTPDETARRVFCSERAADEAQRAGVEMVAGTPAWQVSPIDLWRSTSYAARLEVTGIDAMIVRARDPQWVATCLLRHASQRVAA